VKPGENVEVSLNDSTGVELKGENSNENRCLAEWNQIIHPLKEIVVTFEKNEKTYTSTYKTFFPLVEEVAQKAKVFKNNIHSGNVDFDRLMKLKVDFDLEYFALRFIRTPRKEHPSVADYTPYYKQLMEGKSCIDNAAVLNFGKAKELISLLVDLRAMYFNKMEDYKQLGSRLKWADSTLKNDTIVGIYYSWHLDYFKSFDQIEQAFAEINLDRIPTEYKIAIDNAKKKLMPVDAGIVAYDFTLEDINGKKVSLSDFKGNVIILDFWASWCAPCKKEIPELEKLHEKMSGQAVTFIAVSADTDKKSWEKAVKTREMKGIQLYNNGWGDVASLYKVTGVPRFVAIGKDGVIKSLNAPRPTSGNLDAMVNDLLKADVKK